MLTFNCTLKLSHTQHIITHLRCEVKSLSHQLSDLPPSNFQPSDDPTLNRWTDTSGEAPGWPSSLGTKTLPDSGQPTTWSSRQPSLRRLTFPLTKDKIVVISFGFQRFTATIYFFEKKVLKDFLSSPVGEAEKSERIEVSSSLLLVRFRSTGCAPGFSHH